MIKSAIITAAVAAISAPAAMAGDFYFNPEVNSGWTGSDYGGSIIEGHIGFEHQGWYIQGGPAWVVPDGGDTDTGFTAKTGVSIPVSADLSLYGEVSIAVFDDVDNGYATKVGAKYVF